MTAVFDHDIPEDVAPGAKGAMDAAYSLDETYWGYIIRDLSPTPTGVVLARVATALFGGGLAFATIAIWVFGTTILDDSLLPFRFAASGVTAALAGLCLWYASRGEDIEMQVDTSLGEIREVMRGRGGRMALIGRYGFDAVDSVHLERNGRNDHRATLVLRFADTRHKAPVVRGDPTLLAPLKERLARDLMIGSLKAARFESVDPFEALLTRKGG